VVAPKVAALTHAPDAPAPAEDANLKFTDTSMSNIALLRMKQKLDPLVAKYSTPEPTMVARQPGDAEAAAAAGAGQ
jgi:hypothetical protein